MFGILVFLASQNPFAFLFSPDGLQLSKCDYLNLWTYHTFRWLKCISAYLVAQKKGTIRYLQPHYRLSTNSQPTTDSLQTLYSLLWTLYSLLWTLYRLSTLYYGSLQTLYRLSTATLQQCCAEHRGCYRHYSTTVLCSTVQHCCSTAAAPCSKPEFADSL